MNSSYIIIQVLLTGNNLIVIFYSVLIMPTGCSVYLCDEKMKFVYSILA